MDQFTSNWPSLVGIVKFIQILSFKSYDRIGEVPVASGTHKCVVSKLWTSAVKFR